MKEIFITTKLENTHVGVFAFPFASHAAPLLAIVRSLATAAPNTHFSFFNTAKSNNSIFMTKQNCMIDTKNLKPYNVPDGVPEGYVFVGKPQEEIELFMKTAPDNFRKAMETAEAESGRKVSCLITDAFLWFGAEMGVPWVPFWTAGPVSLSAHLYTDLIRETIGSVAGSDGREDETLSFIPGMSKIRIKDLPEGVLFGNLESLFSRMLHQMGRMLPHAAAVLINSFEQLDPTITNDLNSKFKKFINLGPFNLPNPTLPPQFPDTHGCLNWLDKQNPASVAYISFGTVTTPPAHEILDLAKGLEDSKVPFLWSLKDNLRAYLPNGFLEKSRSHGIIVPWAPQLEVLVHEATGVFVTHCGWNSLIESISCGVPMICRPFFGDQRLNGRTIEEVWEIGLQVEGGVFTKNGILKCLDLTLLREKGKKMREKIRDLKQLAHKAIATKGSSTENFRKLLDLVSSRPESTAELMGA